MKISKRILSVMLSATMVISMTGCGSASTDDSVSTGNTDSDAMTALLSSYEQDSENLTFDDSAWNYDSDNDVYWQISVQYCTDPETTDYETMGIYVPGAYMNAVENEDGTYTCTINTENEVGGYTAETAPIVFPVNTAGYSAQEAPTSYSYDGVAEYLESGFIYVYAGMRGRNNGTDADGNTTYSGGAPWGVTDLKAAVRYYRYNADVLPGSTDSIFTFGHSGGGAQSSLMGATGDSELYYDYLTSIGAAMYDEDGTYISDAIAGAMCWCPITSLDYADAAYEWNMGQYSDEGTRAEGTWTSALSDDLSEAFAEYINELGLTSSDGTSLTLEESDTGIYTSGTYYDYILAEIEESLNNFLSNTEFPYTSGGSTEKADGGFGGAGTDNTSSEKQQKTPSEGTDGEKPSGEAPSGEMKGGMPGGDSSGATEETTYETAQDYIDALNEEEAWITYDAQTNTASITSVEAFVNNCKSATKDVTAFDSLDLSQAENALFGNDDSDSAHFDSVLAALLEENQEEYATYSDWDSSILDAFTDLLSVTDKIGNTLQTREDMYNPMYYLSDYYDGAGTSSVAKYWRIRTGITQGDTALTVETNLALALEANASVDSVDFATVWGQGHTTAEQTGDSSTNFIDWVNECLGK